MQKACATLEAIQRDICSCATFPCQGFRVQLWHESGNAAYTGEDSSTGLAYRILTSWSQTAEALPKAGCGITCAMATPSCGLHATSHAASATPALRLSASATAPRAPPKTSSRMLAFSLASPPARSFTSHRLIPKSRGSSLHSRAESAHVRVHNHAR